MDIPLLFGRFLVKQGRVKEEELSSALKVQKEINSPLGVYCLEHGVIKLEDFMAILKFQREEALSFRDAVLKLRILDEAAILEIEEKQSRSAINIGAILTKKGLMTEDDLEKELANFKKNSHI